MSTTKTFRGRLTNNTQEQIHLAGGRDDIGYRITKFQIMGINEKEYQEWKSEQ